MLLPTEREVILRPMPEVWFRNPDLYIRECLEVNSLSMVWDRGYLHKRSLDIDSYVRAYCPPPLDYRMLVVGTPEQGAQEVDSSTTVSRPLREHMVWMYSDPWDVLVHMVEEPEYEGQMVVVTGIPALTTGPGRRFMRLLSELQEENPHAVVHVHGVYSWRYLFGLFYGSVDIDPRTDAKKGNVTLPTGKLIKFEKAYDFPHWVNLLGFNPSDLSVPRNRCMFNIKSAQWAAAHYKENIRFAYTSHGSVDSDTPYATPPLNNRMMVKRRIPQEGDQLLCDTCTLQTVCKFFRTGAVCTVPDSAPEPLARCFGTRDADTIIDGLGSVLAIQAERLNRGVQQEHLDDKLNPEVTKIANALFDGGQKLAKLLNPALRGPGTKVNVNLGSQVAINASTPQAFLAGIVAEFEARGIPRSSITPEMIEELLSNPEGVQQRVIDVASVPSD